MRQAKVAVVVGVGLGLGSAIAQNYWQLYNQHATAWTLELDLRPAAVEKF
jgi:hypothetical protein